jgi:uncharacterized protein YdhG (YjbR/CyaY superfamily)
LELLMHPEILRYNEKQPPGHREICQELSRQIDQFLVDAECKVWHAHPVWFLDGNPIVGYSRQKPGIRLMFWSGADFGEPGLNVLGGKFKDASVFFNDVSEIDESDLRRWLETAVAIQWDYRNLVRKRRLERISPPTDP